MGLTPAERKIVMSAYSMGPKMVGYIEEAGIGSLAELARYDARELALRINTTLGRPHINAAGVAALENAIVAARRHVHDD